VKQKYNDLIISYTKIQEDYKNEKEKFKDLEKDFKNKMKTHEEEVTIRLKFENKLNDLYSLHSNLK